MNRHAFYRGMAFCLLISLSTAAFGVKFKPAKKRHPTVIGQAAKKREKNASQLKSREAMKLQPFSGISLEMPEADRYPAYRIALPNDSTPQGVSDSWMEFIPDEQSADSTDASAPRSGNASVSETSSQSKDQPVSKTLSQTKDQSASDAADEKSENDASSKTMKHQRIPLPPGNYIIHFSWPLPTTSPADYSIPVMWTVSTRVRKGKATSLSVNIPDITPDRIVHVDLIPNGSPIPFNSFSIELVSTNKKSENLTGRWDYIASGGGWALTIPLILVKGDYRITLASTSFGAFDTLRYEYPEPMKIENSGQLILPFPKFHRLQADIRDRKGVPLLGIPLIFKGKGHTTAMADTRGGKISVMLPEGDYSVTALVFNGKGNQVKRTLEDKLDMRTDQSKNWKAPTTTLDFGLGRIAPAK